MSEKNIDNKYAFDPSEVGDDPEVLKFQIPGLAAQRLAELATARSVEVVTDN